MIIKTEQQYWAVRTQIEKFEAELGSLASEPFDIAVEEYAASLQSQLEELITALQDFENAHL